MLNDEVLERYSRQILLPEIDLVGQENIRRGSVLAVSYTHLTLPTTAYV